MPEILLTGFLGSRATTTYDVVYVLLLLLIPAMVWSLDLLFLRKKYQRHKNLQLILTAVFLVTTALFCFEFFSTGWKHLTLNGSSDIPGITYMTLVIHLVFWAVTLLMWVVLLVQSLRKIPNPPEPCDFGPHYVFWVVLLSLQLFLTALTGWEFYMLAFCF